MQVTQDRDLNINQAAQRLGVHPNTVRNAIDTGKIHATKVLGRWRIKESEIDRVLHGGDLDDQTKDNQ